MSTADPLLVEAQRDIICDPNDENVIASAKANGISDEFLDAARKSPVYKYVVKWKLALPLHIEYRTMPMLFYVPPLLPVMGKDGDQPYDHAEDSFFSSLDKSRLTIQYMARMFSAGNESVIRASLRKLMAVRYYKRMQQVGDLQEDNVKRILREAGTTAEEAEEIYALTAVPTVHKRYVLPPLQREEAIGSLCDVQDCKGSCGFSPKAGAR
jgi:nitrate reductase beta subunit